MPVKPANVQIKIAKKSVKLYKTKSIFGDMYGKVRRLQFFCAVNTRALLHR